MAVWTHDLDGAEEFQRRTFGASIGEPHYSRRRLGFDSHGQTKSSLVALYARYPARFRRWADGRNPPVAALPYQPRYGRNLSKSGRIRQSRYAGSKHLRSQRPHRSRVQFVG